MKTLTEAIRGLNQTYADIDRLKAWAKTENGRRFYKFFGRTSISWLEKQYHVPKFKTEDYFQRLNIYVAVRKLVGYNAPEARFKPLPGFAKVFADKQSSGALKLPKKASKRELMLMNNQFAKDPTGKLIQAGDNKGRKFWNSVTNRPIYKRARQSKSGLQLAEKCHMYELSKMAKWDRRNPTPSKDQLCMDLFPEQAMAAHNMRRSIYLEHVREDLAMRYCGSMYAAPLLRMYSVHRSKGYMNQLVVYEREVEPFMHGYPLSANRTIHESLISAANHNSDSSIIAFKVYDNRGNMRDMIRVAA